MVLEKRFELGVETFENSSWISVGKLILKNVYSSFFSSSYLTLFVSFKSYEKKMNLSVMASTVKASTRMVSTIKNPLLRHLNYSSVRFASALPVDAASSSPTSRGWSTSSGSSTTVEAAFGFNVADLATARPLSEVSGHIKAV